MAPILPWPAVDVAAKCQGGHVGHVFVRLSGYTVRLVPYWPYRFAHVDADPRAVEVTRWTATGLATAVVDATHASPVADVVDILDGPSTGSWRIETSVFTALWPDEFTIESSQDAADPTAFYLLSAGQAVIFPQGPLPAERVPSPADLVAVGQTLVDRWRVGGIEVVELEYQHEAERWWQSHWLIPHGDQHVLILTAQAPAREVTLTRAAAELVATSVTPAAT